MAIFDWGTRKIAHGAIYESNKHVCYWCGKPDLPSNPLTTCSYKGCGRRVHAAGVCSINSIWIGKQNAIAIPYCSEAHQDAANS